MFRELGGDDLANVCLTQAQIIEFCKKYKEWVAKDGYQTFFLVASNDPSLPFFIVCTHMYHGTRRYMGGGSIGVHVFDFGHYVWRAYLRRVVVPLIP